MPDPKESALSRWSRLKRESEAGEGADSRSAEKHPRDPTKPQEAPLEADGRGEPKPDDAPDAVRLEDLPDVETLTYESDFTAFLQKGVPESLQRLALAKLWRSNPVLANLDGLNDYDWDFTEGGLTDAIKALTPEQGDKTPLPHREEVLPGRRPQAGAQPPKQGEGGHVGAADRAQQDSDDRAPDDTVPPRKPS